MTAVPLRISSGLHYNIGMATNPARMSDVELSAARLEIDDPLSLPNLSLDRPSPDLTPEIVGEYHLPSSHDLVWCCHCQSHSHRNGFAVANSTGHHYLLGSECGPKHYGLSFVFAARDHKQKVKRKGILDRMRAIWASAPAVKATIAEVLHSEGLRLIDQKREELRRASDSAFSALSISVKTEMPLYETVSVRDVAAEQRRDEQLPEDQTGGPIYRSERMSLGRVSGAALLRESGDCRDLLVVLRRQIEAVEAFRKEVTDAYSIPQLMKAVRTAEEAWQAAQDAIDEAQVADAFFSGGNLNRLERWSADNRYFKLIADGENLIVSDAQSRQTTILPLPRISLPKLPRFRDAST
jgi:hypothetical protein